MSGQAALTKCLKGLNEVSLEAIKIFITARIIRVGKRPIVFNNSSGMITAAKNMPK